MITIIKHGIKRRKTCPECECEFVYEEEDTYYEGQREEYKVVNCPDCGRAIII